MSAPLAGPATKTFLPQITLKGNSYQRGVQYGKRFKAHLGTFYDWFVRKEPAEIITPDYRAALEKMEAMTSEHFPQLLQKIKGWSDGSGLPYDKCRLLTFHNEVREVIRPGCSNILVTPGAGKPWLGRNCDLYEAERSWQVLITSYCDDCYSHMGFGYLGLPLSIGVNAAGLVIGGASMPSPRPRVLKGMPNLPALLLWTKPTTREACRAIKRLGQLGKGVDLVLLDATGDGVTALLGGGKMIIRRPGKAGFLLATNHDPKGEILPPPTVAPEYLENSRARYGRLTEILQSAELRERTPALGRSALADTKGKIPVCQHVPGGFHTIYSTVVEPGRKKSRVWFSWGYPCRARYSMRTFSGVPKKST